MIEMLYPYWKVPPIAAEHTVKARVQHEGLLATAGSVAFFGFISNLTVPE